MSPEQPAWSNQAPPFKRAHGKHIGPRGPEGGAGTLLRSLAGRRRDLAPGAWFFLFFALRRTPRGRNARLHSYAIPVHVDTHTAHALPCPAMPRQAPPCPERARQGSARLGRARLGAAGLGKARQGLAGLGKERLGSNRLGKPDSVKGKRSPSDVGLVVARLFGRPKPRRLHVAQEGPGPREGGPNALCEINTDPLCEINPDTPLRNRSFYWPAPVSPNWQWQGAEQWNSAKKWRSTQRKVGAARGSAKLALNSSAKSLIANTF